VTPPRWLHHTTSRQCVQSIRRHGLRASVSDAEEEMSLLPGVNLWEPGHQDALGIWWNWHGQDSVVLWIDTRKLNRTRLMLIADAAGWWRYRGAIPAIAVARRVHHA
jgi:hypothetical protein